MSLYCPSKNIRDGNSRNENQQDLLGLKGGLNPVLEISVKTSAWETWSKSRADENMMSIYERKILRSIFGGIQEKGTWRRSNLELYRSFKESDIVNFVKKQRIKWAGQVIRMNEDRITKKVFNAQPMGT
ncbi:UNVERIFIED_CONTAM: hypothetical protein NCL1_11453 [Trichonephila clavipes]